MSMSSPPDSAWSTIDSRSARSDQVPVESNLVERLKMYWLPDESARNTLPLSAADVETASTEVPSMPLDTFATDRCATRFLMPALVP